MNILDFCKSIKKIYLRVEKTIDKSTVQTNQAHDELALNYFEQFINELIECNPDRTQAKNPSVFLDYLSSKYLATLLDPLDPTIQVRIVRKTIAKIIDKINI
jgi:Glu-tRNA(Gln) amidotransferase subunit E-like FAD-binding protein